MLPQQHVFSHQQFSDWNHQNAAHHGSQQQQHVNPQQQHYNRMAATSNASTTPSLAGLTPGDQLTTLSNVDQGITDENRRMLDWIAQLMNPTTRETALLELSKKREQVPELALILWHSFGMLSSKRGHFIFTDIFEGVMTSLLQEIISVYPLLNPSQLTAAASNRVCNALALLQCIASHTETRQLFLNGMDLLPRRTVQLLIVDSSYSSLPLSLP